RYNRRVDPESDLPYQGLEQREATLRVPLEYHENARTLFRKEEPYYTGIWLIFVVMLPEVQVCYDCIVFSAQCSYSKHLGFVSAAGTFASAEMLRDK
ncbi:cbp/p300-interacting transactivator 4a, partial [Tachysurus ichikawai]